MTGRQRKNIKILHRGLISFLSFIISDPDVLLAHIGGWICLICMRESSSTWACFIRLIFVISTVIGSITKPPFGYAAIIGTLELVNRATVVSWKEQQKQKIQHMSNRKCFVLKKYILYLRMLQRISSLTYISVVLFFYLHVLLCCWQPALHISEFISIILYFCFDTAVFILLFIYSLELASHLSQNMSLPSGFWVYLK